MPGPPLAKRGAPHWPPYRPSDGPPGPMATASLTGHLLATYWPSGRPPPLAKRGGPDWPPDGGAFARPSPDWQKGREGEPLATRELQPPTSRPPDGVGFFACKGGRCVVARVPDPPFGDPYTPTPTD